VNGVEDPGWSPSSITWKVESSTINGLSTGTAGVWTRDAGAKNGLMWVGSPSTSVDGTTDWSADTVTGTASTGTTAWLADIVGSRTVTITASDGNETSEPASFTFGKGPLSVFSKTGTGYVWATNAGNSTSNGFQSSGNAFPAAGFCRGSVKPHNEDIINVGPGSASFAGFDPGSSGGWSDAESVIGMTQRFRYAKDSKLAKEEQLLAVAAYNGSHIYVQGRKGAALAAGWSLGTENRVWTGEVTVNNNSVFCSQSVDLDTGFVGWYIVNNGTPATVCVP
jgi:hypothetical protein